ncbi:E3 SUMO-protein ligase ZBED1-like [Ischnura elegans]|uniref:E3 SUMO-protein ligase ZBED1-like n=1 Tax=Ischnura elegans TaxID=197161 RepID=UPI001ED87086|nr:E3 SUMO-protein ligase ZBED1-like [Ischnura elegans]
MDSKRRRSEVWHYFQKISAESAECLFCKHQYSFKSGCTSNLFRHIKLKHPSISLDGNASKRTCQSSNESGEQVSQVPSTSAASASSLPQHPDVSIDIPQGYSSDSTLQTTMKQYIHRPLALKTSQSIDEGLVKLIVSQYLPFSLVEQPAFKSFLQLLNPNYHPPSRKTLANNYLELLYSKTAMELKEKIKKVTFCSITADGWTSATNDSYLAVTAHFICNGQLQSALLDCIYFTDRHTATNIADEIHRIIRSWDLDSKVVALISDSAANMLAAAKILGWTHIPCFAHTLNLIVQNALVEVKDLQNRVKKVVEFFKRSPAAHHKLVQMQSPQGSYPTLKQEVPTRWNSTYIMFQSILRNKEPLLSTLALLKTEATLTQKDFEITEKLCHILLPFYEVTLEVSSEKHVTASKLIPLTQGMKRYLETLNFDDQEEEVSKFLAKIKSEMERRFSHIEDIPLLAEASMVDPRFKNMGFDSHKAIEKAKNNLIRKATAVSLVDEAPGTSQEIRMELETSGCVWKHLDSLVQHKICDRSPTAAAITEVDKYLKEPHLLRHEDPLQWWCKNQGTFPRLFLVMQKRLCIVGSSVPCERVFSKAGNILSERRRSLKPNKLSKILFLNYNLD